MTTSINLAPDLTEKERCFVILDVGDRAGLWSWIASAGDTFTVLLDGQAQTLTAKQVEGLATRQFLRDHLPSAPARLVPAAGMD